MLVVVLPLPFVLLVVFTVFPCQFASSMPFAIEHVSSVRWFGAARKCDFVVLNLNSCHLSCLWKYLCQFIWDELDCLGPDRHLNYLLVNIFLVHSSDKKNLLLCQLEIGLLCTIIQSLNCLRKELDCLWDCVVRLTFIENDNEFFYTEFCNAW